MSSLISQIFEPEKAKLLAALYKNESDEGKVVIMQTIAKQLAQSDEIILGHELDQICLLMSEADFLLSEEEPIQVAAMIFWCMRQTDIFPMISEQTGKDLGSRCLVSLSLFEPALREKTNRFGAPSPDFYRKVGKASLASENISSVAINFDKWTHFINESLV